eukprot:TRINITY_DN14182_c1_g2_i1.p1 TRINITY_DN14182_c1_g2~~TRINITY_DN14182_c1_g2_i1.p1  ORF type:complete len:534 (+),score=84.39 TRINITY_DN14182_c1_g2_i1:61-1602(+)
MAIALRKRSLRRLKAMSSAERIAVRVLLSATARTRYHLLSPAIARSISERLFPNALDAVVVETISPVTVVPLGAAENAGRSGSGSFVTTEVDASLAWTLKPPESEASHSTMAARQSGQADEEDVERGRHVQQRVGLQVLRPMLSPDEVRRIVSLLPTEFDLDRGDLEQIPKRWIVVERNGQVQEPHASLAFEMSKAVKNRLLPYVRKRYKCPDCALCSSIVRRYYADVLGERWRDPPHTDGQALVTVVVALDTAGVDYDGGLYVVTDPDRPHFISLAAGEAVVHGWDLQHGVEVRRGRRLSWILWFQDKAPCVRQPEFHQRHFFSDAAQSGNVIAMHILGSGPSGAQGWLRKAAEAGFPRSMGQLGASLQIEDKVSARRWLQLAAARGDVAAKAELGMLLLRAGEKKKAALWLQRAAEDGSAVAQYDFGMALHSGALERQGSEPRLAAAVRWLLAAARQGHAPAQSALGVCYAEGQGVERSLSLAAYWWQEAMIQGDREATRNLELMQRSHPT